ncbi:Phage tail-collar fibre protein, partial [Persephonella hydrogeniphila]
LVAIGNYPETYKPVLSQGSGNDMYIRFIMEVENVDSVQLKIDPAIVLASRKYVDDEITAHDTSSTSHADIRTEIDNIKNGNTTVGNADKLDGLNSVNFIKALFHAGAVANTDLNSLVEAQTVYCDTTNTNLPSSYAGYLLVFGNGSNRIGQLFLSQDGNLYFRRSDDGVNWSPWGKVWFNGNDGVNSGLDADLLRGLPADFGSSLASSGYQKLPSGLIIQWGIVPRGSNDGTISVAFPIAFPNSVFGVGVSANSIGLTDARISRVHNVSLTGFDSVVDYFNTARDAGYSEFWVAIGY